MTRNDAKNEVKGYLSDYLKRKGINPRKAFTCLNPAHTDKHPSMSYDDKHLRCKCFSCGAAYDIFDLIGMDYGLSDPKDIFSKAYEIYNITVDKPSTSEKKPMKEKEPVNNKKEAPAEDYTSFYRECHEALLNSPEALEYLHGRGIDDNSIKRFNLGYCEKWKHSKSGERVAPTKRIIIPRTKETYTARRIDKPQNDIEAQYVKQVQGTQKDLFNLEALEGAEIVIVCEGELDAISLLQAGASSVVGLGSTTNCETFAQEAEKHPEIFYVIALDNDPDKENGTNPGKKAQKDLKERMRNAGLNVVDVDTAMLYNGEKDANDALNKDKKYLSLAVAHIEETMLPIKQRRDAERAAELRKRTGEGMLETFLSTVTKTRDFEPISTGVKDLDRALQGGFTRKTLVMLGAPPAMGKTAFAQWILENMASAGHDVLYINLEMSREQLLARSLSRYVWKYEKKDLTPLDILRGYEWTDEQRDAITRASDVYKKDVAPHFIYNPDGITNGIDSILTAMDKETKRIKAQGKLAPIVCVDYLQIVDSGERDAIEGMKSVIFKLKDFAKRENTVIFVIMANNRTSNKSGTVDMESGRDTSAIEYSADLMLGLSYTAIEDRRKYEDEEKKEKVYDLDRIRQLKKEAYEAGKPVSEVCNEVSLKILKNRFGEPERRANFIFDGAHNTFMQKEYTKKEVGGEWEPVVSGNPFLR